MCKRFRRIAISQPGLWARIRIRPCILPQYALDTIVERSGTRKLSVDVIAPFRPSNSIAEHGDRWSDIKLDDFSTDEFHLFQRLTPSSKLTSLRTLRLSGRLPQSATQIYEFDPGWLPPSVEILYCAYTIPKGLASSSLTTCFFEFEYAVDFRGLVDVLSSTPLLQTLGITIGEAWEIEMVEDTLIYLPFLQDFSFQSLRAEHQAVEQILRATHFPKITTLGFNILYTIGLDGLAHINACFWRELLVIKDSYMNLKKLNLGIVLRRLTNGDYLSYSMNDILADLPKTLESLSLSIKEVELRADGSISLGNLGQLRSLEFYGCNRLVPGFFEDLATWFQDEKMLLDVLDIQKCRIITGTSNMPEEAAKALFRNAGVLQS